MKAHGWTVRDLRVEHRCRIFDVVSGDYERDDGFRKSMFTLRCPDWANVVTVTRERELLLVRQYRPGPDQFTWEMPGGVIDPGEAPIDAAARELREETGFVAGAMETLGSCFPNPALQSNRIHFFLATEAERVGEPIFDGEGEQCELVRVPLAELDDLLDNAAFSHALCWAALARAGRRLQGLRPVGR